jgi:uncharacterized protein (TIRG00374 family)
VTSRSKTVLQYTFILAATGALIWFSLRGLTVADGENKWDYLLRTWNEAEKGWLFLMAFVVMISHIIRAERWKMLIAPAGHAVKLGDSFLSLMVGYIVNLVIPRGGEVSRCYNLFKLDKTPVEISFGTVVVERLVDVICLLVLIAISFLYESEKLFAFIQTLPLGTDQGSRTKTILLLAGGLVILGGIFFLVVKKSKRLNAFLKNTWLGFREGLLTVFKLKSKGLFIVYSVSIWLLYFLMSYCVMQAFPETDQLGIGAVLSLFAIGSIAMAAPLPGGTGSYHVLVPQGLVFLYHIPQADAVAFTFIFHGWQTAIMIVGGAVSLIITSILVKRRSAEKK